MLYSISKASKAYGADEIFQDVNFEIKGTEKIAIVGRNGCGKTTFLRCMCGEESFDHANIAKQNGTEIGYLAQKVLSHDDWTVEQELMTIYEPIFALQKKINELEDKMANDYSEKVMNQYGEAQEKFEAMNGYHWESEMKTVFTRFGFPIEQLSKKIGEFSGGQKTRIAFVKLLLSKPDILLLDEPTNHLDIDAIEWLEGYVKSYPKAVVVVSHDRMFLDHTVDCVYNMEYGKMTRYPGNYSNFVVERENDLERQQDAYNRQQKDVERLQALIEKFRYKRSKAAFAQSKIKYLDRMEMVTVDKSDTRNFHAHFTPNVKGGEKVLETDHLAIGYDHVLTEVTMKMRRGDRIAVIGPNGTGKSTFVKTLMELIPSLGGSFLFGHQIEKGYFDQQLAQFSSGKTVLEEVWDDYPELDRTAVRSVLGQFLFSADDVFKSVDVLSGGEKVRLSFAKLLLQHSNLLILDEPTNHLDIPGKEALEQALKGFSGTILFVSHDRYFIQQLATGLLKFENGKAEFIEANWNEYEEQETSKASMVMASEKKQPAEEAPAQETRRQLSPEAKAREIKKLEEKITDKEGELEDLRDLRYEPEYYQDYQKMNVLDGDIDDVHNELAHLYQKWDELNEDA
ncbi:MAG: ABC-F family ATP-binding cassette domain-containing protein [Solobacterium sp.]|nr:ABC-F family ATP-binding cassette domain-containing protein [Solobacterium sp.]MCH4205539.1 ABC-F family ATP-binding cassette domain-containing protein [Solobacterium sp.]MCH4227126.1 ABC-F family ATP-binding cassette domain-containing protein [Solobacterium sp.]MCH4282302.1 ABC-F family ATP-binding cassette domain-containing protein [Solobacterium sp.]